MRVGDSWRKLASSDLGVLVLWATTGVLLHAVTNGKYGFHHDELATLDDARSLAWGYVASPPLRRPTGKPAKLPAPAPSPTSSLSPATLKKLVQASRLSVRYESFPSPKAVNTTTGPQLPKYVSAAFGSLDLPWFINLSCICFAAGAAFLFLALRPSFAQKANPSSQSLATKVDENILTRSMLTDDWAGARSLLGGYGVRFGPEFTQFYQGLFAGIGPSSFEYAGRFDGFIDVDLSKLADTRWLPEILRA